MSSDGTPRPGLRPIERLSLELSNVCRKGCAFCYSRSVPGGGSEWSPDDVVAFVGDCATRGTIRAVSFGGGEPLEYPGLFEILERLDGVLFRSLTTNGLELGPGRLEPTRALDALVRAKPDKVHVSIHFPDRAREVERVRDQVVDLASRGVRSGVNLLVRRSDLRSATEATNVLYAAGIGPERIVFLPMRGDGGIETPTPAELAAVAGTPRFQSMTCLAGCAKSPRFCAVAWDRTVAWCSYTRSRVRLAALDFPALERALFDLDLTYCGTPDDRRPDEARLVRLSRRPLDGHDLVRDRSGRSGRDLRER